MQSSKPQRGCWMQAASAARAVRYNCLTPQQHHACGSFAAAAAARSASGDVLGVWPLKAFEAVRQTVSVRGVVDA